MKTTALALALCCAALVTPVSAGIDIELGANVQLGDDSELFLSISARYFDHDRAAIDRVAVRYRNPDDLAVALYLGKRANVKAERIHRMRRDGLDWWQISVQLGLPSDIWFVRVDRDPGPPYGKAYGHWKNHQRDKHRAFALSDAEARDLVAVRMLHEYYGVSAQVAMEWRADGRDLRRLVSTEYRSRHGKQERFSAKNSKHPGKGNARGKSKR
jgi:hypothetical protein